MVSDKVIDVSAGWILRVLNVSSRLLQQKAMINREWQLQAINCFRYAETFKAGSH